MISLFTNVPNDLVVDSIIKRWFHLQNHVSISLDEFIIAIKLILNSTFFTFDNVIYQQTFGSPMGSPLSPIIADLVSSDLEKRALSLIQMTIPIYFRFVDDILIAAPLDKFDDILNIFNSIHNRLQFTLEYNINDNSINFLDVSLFVSNSRKIYFDWYHKLLFK